MADEDQVALLRQGVSQWNAWRKETNSDVNLNAADLRGANLNGVDLTGANLSGASLGWANLVRADFSRAKLVGATLGRAHLPWAKLGGAKLDRADLSGASLFQADLSRAHLLQARLTGAKLLQANLSGANLGEANLFEADLSETNLSGANLTYANLNGANLSYANLSKAGLGQAMLFETILGNVDLSTALGLETCLHSGPSIIDFRTLQRSGRLPLAFLRGVGLSDLLIDYLPSLLNEPIQMYSCFISYSSKDQDFADRLHADLQNNGVRCWFAPHDLPIGAKTWDAIDEAIRLRDKLLLILSENSISSDWVEDEVTKASAEERDRKRLVLFPVRIDDAVMETSKPWARKLRDQRHIGDFRKWKDHDGYQASLKRLLRDLTVEKS
ncbi:MAG TPA: toll/interleukin-1 receptor domain-containing protein [Methylocella sp.]|nr:toll/interleukin-1 receptor domain-containing protein [Methylocella sp.]